MDIAAFHTRRRFAEVESGRIAYFEDGEGPVALFVHGVSLNGYHWRHVIDRVRHRRRCIAVDLMVWTTPRSRRPKTSRSARRHGCLFTCWTRSPSSGST